MSKKLKIKWVEPRVVSLEQLPTSLGACSDGNTAATGGGTKASNAEMGVLRISNARRGGQCLAVTGAVSDATSGCGSEAWPDQSATIVARGATSLRVDGQSLPTGVVR